MFTTQGTSESCRAFTLVPARFYIFINGGYFLWVFKVRATHRQLVEQACELLGDSSAGACSVGHRQRDCLFDVGTLHLETVLPRGQGTSCACHHDIATMTLCMQFTCNKISYYLAKVTRDVD